MRRFPVSVRTFLLPQPDLSSDVLYRVVQYFMKVGTLVYSCIKSSAIYCGTIRVYIRVCYSLRRV